MSNNKATVVIGASPNADRYSYKATISLQNHQHTVYPVGLRKGVINGLEIITDKPGLKDIDTVTLYVGPDNQPYWYDYILSLKPKRLIFNPGTKFQTTNFSINGRKFCRMSELDKTRERKFVGIAGRRFDHPIVRDAERSVSFGSSFPSFIPGLGMVFAKR